MKVVLLNGSPRKHGCTNRALDEMERVFSECNIDVMRLHIGRDPIRGCQACKGCAQSSSCVFDEGPVQELIDAISAADGLVIGSPVYYSGANGALCALLDRAFYAASSKFAFKPACAIASARRAGTTETISRLNQYFQICNMPIAASTYWPMVHGNTPEEVEQDEEGLQTLRNLARQMTWMMQSFAVAKQEGVELPAVERTVWTNFIR